MSEARRQARARRRQVRFGGFIRRVEKSEQTAIICRHTGDLIEREDGQVFVSINGAWVPAANDREAKRKVEKALKIKHWRRNG